MSSGVTAACDSTVTVLLLSPLLTPSFRSKFQASFLCLKLKFQLRETRVSSLETNGFKQLELEFQAYGTKVVLNPAYVIAKVSLSACGIVFLLYFGVTINFPTKKHFHYGKYN